VAAVRGEVVRPAEWRRVREFASAARAVPAALAVRGEAGSGKSTLWRAGVEAAGSAGYRVMRCEPAANEADMSFAGLSDLLADWLADVAGDIPGPQLEALEIALLLRPAGSEPPAERAIGLAVLSALRAVSGRGQLVVAVDDVQWLDQASLDALRFAVRRLVSAPVAVLLAARTTAVADPLTAGAAPLSERWRELLAAADETEEIELAPLDLWQIQNLLPPSLTAAQVRLIARLSRGNPFWAKEVAAAGESAQAGTAEPSAAPVPALAKVLTDRLARSLSQAAAEALAAVAAAGRISVPEAIAVLDHLDDPAAALDSAILAGVLAESGGRITVAHPLIGAAAVDALPPGRRARLYGRLAAAADGPERFARFAALAAGTGPDASVAEALDAAAAAAHARAANAAAAQFAAQAVRFSPEASAEALVRRRIRAAELLSLAGDMESSLAQLEVLDLDRLETRDLERALPLLLDGADILTGAASATEVVARLADAPSSDLRRRALVLALASDPVYGVGSGRRAAAEEAIACAEAAGDPAAPALHRAVINLVIARFKAGQGLDAGLLDRAGRLESTVRIARLYDTADLHRGLWSRFADDIEGARAALNRVMAGARKIGDDFALCGALSYLAGAEELAGDYPAAAAALRAADAVAAWHDWPPQVWSVQPTCELAIAAGDFTAALALIAELGDSRPLEASFVAELVSGKVAAWQQKAPAAAAHFEQAAGYADACGWADPGLRHRVDAWLAQALVTVGRLTDATAISARLRAAGERLGRPSVIGDASRIDALIAAQEGDLGLAAGLAGAAVAAHASSPLRLELARSLLVLGMIERRRKARGQASEALRRARDLTAELDHRPLLAEVEDELSRVTPARSGHELTVAERRVADLIAAGSTNREAAAALFVSVRTVETHVASIYRKLGIRTRAELARAVIPPPASQ
jgi:DNA-binding CsgD family transcriptional regulator